MACGVASPIVGKGFRFVGSVLWAVMERIGFLWAGRCFLKLANTKPREVTLQAIFDAAWATFPQHEAADAANEAVLELLV